MKKMSRKNVLIAGGSEGIGLSLAQEFLSQGASVHILSRSEDKLLKAQASLKPFVPADQELKTYSLDVTNWAAVNEFVGGFPCPDVLINCAGLALPGYIDELSMGDFHKMMDLNYFGTVHLTKALIPKMKKARKGHIVNVSSMAGYIGLFGYTGYCASKYAVIGFSEALEQELRPFGIGVSVLCPPNTKTPGLEAENRSKPREVLLTEEKAKVVEPAVIASFVVASFPRPPFWLLPTFDGKVAFKLKQWAPFVLKRLTQRPTQVTQ
ncbi:MAG: SDR family oxidoreductase [Bdellovibrionales bacterium]|nr:SDR family oxidoreductase [Bdellovibrionales bacterium]